MKKIVLLDDNPGFLQELVSQLKKYREICIQEILYFTQDVISDESKIRDIQEKLGVKVRYVNQWNFDEVMDKLYADKDTLFLFDNVIETGYEEEIFEYRIYIHYALMRKDDRRIWFYTAARSVFKNRMNRLFPGYVILENRNNHQVLNLEECSTFMKNIRN